MKAGPKLSRYVDALMVHFHIRLICFFQTLKSNAAAALTHYLFYAMPPFQPPPPSSFLL